MNEFYIQAGKMRIHAIEILLKDCNIFDDENDALFGGEDESSGERNIETLKNKEYHPLHGKDIFFENYLMLVTAIFTDYQINVSNNSYLRQE